MSTSIQNKLLQYAPQPPEKVWDAIVTVLDANTSVYAEKLYVFEEEPSPQVWDKIHKQLDPPQPARTAPVFRQYKKLASYSVAAILLLAIVTTVLVIATKPVSPRMANRPAAQNQQAMADSNVSSSPRATESSGLLVTAGPNKIASSKNSIRDKKNLLSRLRPQTSLGSVMIAKTFIPQKAETRQTIRSDIPLEKYMVYSDGDGNAMRLPKKLFDFISCAKEDIGCRQEMQQWQQQFAAAVLTTDFTGVLEILKTLKENQ